MGVVHLGGAQLCHGFLASYFEMRFIYFVRAKYIYPPHSLWRELVMKAGKLQS